jgi:hypothetical protein
MDGRVWSERSYTVDSGTVLLAGLVDEYVEGLVDRYVGEDMWTGTWVGGLVDGHIGGLVDADVGGHDFSRAARSPIDTGL